MLLSSMDHLNYYAMPKESYLEVDTGAPHHHHLGGHLQAPPPPPPLALGLSGGYALPGEDLSAPYLGGQNEENSPKNGTKSSLYKTELCKRFSEFGNCRYGAKCQFAHGIAELRHVVRHPKYKTTKCKSYWGSGHCPYGSRCRFIHEETEAFAQPQFSPPAGMGGSGSLSGAMFKEQQFGSLMMPPSANNGNNNGNDLSLPGYGLYAAPSSYAKDYSLFDKSATWAPATARVSPHGGASKLSGSFSSSSVPPPPPQGLGGLSPAPAPAAPASSVNSAIPSAAAAAASAATAASGSSTYPDLQDAIDALMKFSLTSEGEAGASAAATPAGLKSPTLADASLAKATGTDFALESDELWKDFPAASDLSDKLREPQHWSSGLSLSLDASPFDVAGAAATPAGSADKQAALAGSGTASGSSSNSEESPRLSVFERFH